MAPNTKSGSDWQDVLRIAQGFPLIVKRVSIPERQIAIEGEFTLPELARLSLEDQVFITAFLRSHGSIKEMEQIFGVSYPTIKQWIYHRKLRAVKTPGGHYRIPQSEIDRLLYRSRGHNEGERRVAFQRISGRNQLVGRIVDVRVSGLVAQVTLSVGGQLITSLITSGAAREMNLKPGQTAGALIKATEVMILRV